MVHNTAPPFSLGYHWVAILIDRTKSTPGLEFYDSISKGEPSSESHIGRTWAQFKKWNDKKLFSEKPLPVRVNTVKVQTQGVECGMFALRFLTQRLQGKTMAELDQRNAVNDSACAALRSKYFLPYKSPASKAKEVATAAKSLIDFNELKMKVRKCIAEKEKLPSAKNLPKGVLQLKPFFKVTISADQKKAKVEFDKDVKISQPKKYKYIIIGIEIDGKLKNAALMDVTNKRLLFATTAKTKALKKLFRDHENKLWQNLL